MTMKYLNKTVSAENEYVLKDASFNPSTMTLTISKKNLYSGVVGTSNDQDATNDPIIIAFNDFKLRISKLNSISELNTLANTNTDAARLERETHLFLVPLDGSDAQDADEYEEYVWVDNKNKFEKVGTTRIDLESLRIELMGELDNYLLLDDIETLPLEFTYSDNTVAEMNFLIRKPSNGD